MHSESNMGRTVVFGNYEWDEEKNRANAAKHGITFEETVAVFDDPYFLELYDEAHSEQDEQRTLGIGAIHGLVIVATVFTERTRTRIISSRHANPSEEKRYYERIPRHER